MAGKIEHWLKARKLSKEESNINRPDFPNEAINLQKECIFIAIPKTGSTSIREQLKQNGSPLLSASHLNILQVRELIYPFLLSRALGKNQNFPSTNISSDIELRQEAETIFGALFKFSAVRNPWARAVSIYFRKEGVEVRKEMDFEQFCKQHRYASDTCLYPTLHSNQADWLQDENGNMVMDFVYKIEELETAIDKIKELTHGKVELVPRMANDNPNSKSHHYRELYNDKTRQLIAKQFEKDIDTFKYSF